MAAADQRGPPCSRLPRQPESEIDLLTAPVQAGGRPADGQTIGDALRQLYQTEAALDRPYVYFSGHGLMAPTDAAHGLYCSAIVPSDVRDLERDATCC